MGGLDGLANPNCSFISLPVNLMLVKMAACSDSPSLVDLNSGKLQCFRRRFEIDKTIAEILLPMRKSSL